MSAIKNKQWIIGLVLLLVIIAVALQVAGPASVKQEKRSGLLKYSAGSCLLVTPQENAARIPILSDGLEGQFCENNKDLIGTYLTVRGTRVSGDAINQDCSNRSCFADVHRVLEE